jgi:LacI family transcriptional regulator
MTRRAPTLAQVASSAGVSRMTASRALANKPGVSAAVRDRIFRIASELGYVVNPVARDLASGRSRVIGILCADLQAPFIAEVIQGAIRAARTAACEVLVYSLFEPNEELREAVVPLLARSTQGVISLLVHRHDYLPLFRAAGVQVVTIENAQGSAYTVTADSYNGARSAMRHLIELGHRRIAYIGSRYQMPSSSDRRRGYEDVMREHGLRLEPQLVVSGDNTQATGFVAARRLLGLENPPTAILANNDPTALGVLDAARAARLEVPHDLSVVGFDDVPQAALALPPLTTVRQPLQQIGRSAMNTLLAVLAGIEAVAPVITFPTELVVRGSTAPPRASRARAGPRGRGRRAQGPGR